jgi:hypothetical protein
MELIKREDRYDLYADDGQKLGSTANGKLSKSNCDKIFGVFDVEKLAKELYSGHVMAVDWQLEKRGFKTGFNKAMELNKDKLFTEDDVNLAFVLGKNNDESRINKLINSRLQPTEIEVEILTRPYTDVHEGFKLEPKREAKLDSEGCLILKPKP